MPVESQLTADLLRDCFGAVALAVILAGVGWSSYLIARRVLPRAPAAVRACGALVVGFWLTAALFWMLAPAGLFRLPIVLALLTVLTGAAHRLAGQNGAFADLRRDVRSAAVRLRGLAGGPAGWLLAGTGGLALLRALRGTAAPPLGWDSLTYHLFKAGRWVQNGGLAPHSAPDAWSYYEYYPVVGDQYWAWVMLPFRSDLAITAAGLGIWAVVLLGVYACARELGARVRPASMAAAAVAAMPSVIAFLSSGYVDNTTLALFLLGSLFVVRLITPRDQAREQVRRRTRRVVEAPLAVGALALMLGVKLTTAALFALGGIVVVVSLLRSTASWQTRRIVLLSCLAAAAVGAPSYLRVWVEQGSPFYPFRIELAGVTLSEGSDAAAEVAPMYLSSDRYRLDGPADFWMYFLTRQKSYGAFVNPGPAVLVIAVLALAALPGLVRDRRRLLAAGFFVGCALVLLLGFLSGSMEVFRKTIKVTTAGRYLTPGIAAVAVVAATRSGWFTPFLWGAATVAGIVLGRPVAWAPAEIEGTLGVALIAAGATGFLWALAGPARRRGVAPTLLILAGLFVTGVAGAGVGSIRRSHRYEIWAAASDPASPTFHMHALGAHYAAAWPIWKALDDPTGHRIAVTAGWDRVGHNWYRYPLLGSRLQNRVLYVPITGDGSIVDYRTPTEVGRRGDYRAWLERLVEARVDYVVSLAPRWTIEDQWMRNTPELFETAVVAPRELHVAFRFRLEEARRTLGRSGAGPG